MTVDEGLQPYEPPPTTLTTTVLTGPDRLQVSDATGPLAMLTVGAKTVTMRGQQRTFTEQKRPFVDAFTRTSLATFGASPGGGNWSNSGTDTLYTVSGGVGQISCDVANSSRHATVLDDLANVDVTAKVTVTTVPAGATASIGLSFGYTATNNANRARLLITTAGVVQLTLEKEVGGTVTTLGAATQVGTGFAAGDWWRIRAERAGTTIRCRAWKDGTTEPATWLFSFTDTSLLVGRVGFRALASTGSTGLPRQFKVDDLTLNSGTWPDPPVITHNQWVRVLDTPFSGTWTPALANQIRTWAVDTSPDALAYALMYTTGAPTVTSPALSGAQIAGQCNYGPLDTAGHPIEGADFHDYMGVNWVFPNGETQAAGAGETGCMDCSGYVRMLYGYHLGIPMVRNTNFDGVNLPRQIKDIGPSGPGVIIAQSASSAPSMTSMQIGDIVLFDADDSDATPGQIDHDGIYLGTDTAGHPRFANSRRSPNGPTFGDLGGSSTLDGAGLYATSLRIIRRF
ncbi:NlpC/P60 family protein [Streptomyces sp. NPDC049967]|uniref:NlpC/P60 family protein n=1 Tax=Streptomyces sp. NPDC049967 TaxID=3155658 RepID=UPI003427A42D